MEPAGPRGARLPLAPMLLAAGLLAALALVAQLLLQGGMAPADPEARSSTLPTLRTVSLHLLRGPAGALQGWEEVAQVQAERPAPLASLALRVSLGGEAGEALAVEGSAPEVGVVRDPDGSAARDPATVTKGDLLRLKARLDGPGAAAPGPGARLVRVLAGEGWTASTLVVEVPPASGPGLSVLKAPA